MLVSRDKPALREEPPRWRVAIGRDEASDEGPSLAFRPDHEVQDQMFEPKAHGPTAHDEGIEDHLLVIAPLGDDARDQPQRTELVRHMGHVHAVPRVAQVPLQLRPVISNRRRVELARPLDQLRDPVQVLASRGAKFDAQVQRAHHGLVVELAP